MKTNKVILASLLVLAAVFSRLIPHPPNFTPIAATALFGGAYFNDKKLSFAIPLIALFLSDLILGLHTLLPVVYACFALIVLIGFRLRENKSVTKVGIAAISSSVIFFIVTNFGVWLIGSYYSKTIEGLTACYVAAIPFFQNSLSGDLFYTGVLFGGFELVRKYTPILQEA